MLVHPSAEAKMTPEISHLAQKLCHALGEYNITRSQLCNCPQSTRELGRLCLHEQALSEVIQGYVAALETNGLYYRWASDWEIFCFDNSRP